MSGTSVDGHEAHAHQFFIEWSRAHEAAGFPADATVSVTPWASIEGADGATRVASGTLAEVPGVIQDGTLAWAILKVRPFNLDQGLVLTPSKSTEGNAYLDVELTLIDGKYGGQTVSDSFAISGRDGADGMAKVRHILEVGREIVGFAPADAKYRLGATSGAKGDMVLLELDELRCAVKIGVEPEANGFPAKNKIRAYLSPNPTGDTFKTFNRLVAGDTGRDGKSAPKTVRERGAVLRLDDPAGIADEYLAAVGEFRHGSPDFASQDEWDIAAGATVGIQRADGAIETTWATFDDADGEDSPGNAWVIHWNEEAAIYGAIESREWSECEGPIPGEGEATTAEFGRHAAGLLKTWANRSKLMRHSGAVVAEHNAYVGEDNVRRFVLRCGFLSTRIGGGCNREQTLGNVGLGRVGAICLGHLAAIAGCEPASAGIDDAFLVRAAAKWKLCGENFETLMRLPDVATLNQHVTFIVPGYIPRGELTIVAGDAECGKSTLLHDLAIIVGTKPEQREVGRTWLDVPVSLAAQGTTALLSGEDSRTILMDRRIALCGGTVGEADILEIALNGDDDPDACLDRLRTVDNIALLIVDPARSFIKGNEDDSSNVDVALSTLQRFGAEKNCAVVVLHHLRKSARPTSPRDAVEGLRGSGAFKARARVAIGLVRRGDVVSVGVAKHNMPPQYPMQTETKKFLRQDGVPRLISPAVDAVVKSVHDRGASLDVAQIANAVAAARARNTPLMRSGRQGIFEIGLPELADMTRNGVRGATKRALEAGVVSLTPDGYLVPAEVSAGDVPAVAEPHPVNAATRSKPAGNAGESMG